MSRCGCSPNPCHKTWNIRVCKKLQKAWQKRISLPHERSPLQWFSWSLSQFQSSFCLHQIVVHHTQHTKAAGPFAVLCKVEVKARLQPILVGPSLPVLKISQNLLCNHRCLKKSVATVCFAASHGSFLEFGPWSSEPGILHQKGFWHCQTIEDQAHWPHSSGATKCWRRKWAKSRKDKHFRLFYLEKEHEGREMDHKKEGLDFAKYQILMENFDCVLRW